MARDWRGAITFRCSGSYKLKFADWMSSLTFDVKGGFGRMGIFGRLFAEDSKAATRVNEDIEILRNSNLVDAIWYRQAYPEAQDPSIDVVRHYAEHGAGLGRDPNPLFHTKYYLGGNPEIARAGANPLVHYILHGARERRNPNPLFDTAFYLDQSPDVVASGMNPLDHYLRHGARELRNPHPLFDTKY